MIEKYICSIYLATVMLLIVAWENDQMLENDHSCETKDLNNGNELVEGNIENFKTIENRNQNRVIKTKISARTFRQFENHIYGLFFMCPELSGQ